MLKQHEVILPSGVMQFPIRQNSHEHKSKRRHRVKPASPRPNSINPKPHPQLTKSILPLPFYHRTQKKTIST